MKEAIQKAIKGGWWPKFLNASRMTEKGEFRKKTSKEATEDIMQMSYVLPSIWLDPLFWQALGKALGWRRKLIREGYSEEKSGRSWFVNDDVYADEKIPEWHYQMHRFIDHLAEGKDAESFFNELLK